MGSGAAAECIDKVIEIYGKELIIEVNNNLPLEIKGTEISLTNSVYSLVPIIKFPSGSYLPLVGWDIDELAIRYPDLDISY